MTELVQCESVWSTGCRNNIDFSWAGFDTGCRPACIMGICSRALGPVRLCIPFPSLENGFARSGSSSVLGSEPRGSSRSRTQTSARAATLAAFLAAPEADTAVQHAIGDWLCGGRNPGAAARTTKQQRGQTSLDFCQCCHARWRKADQHADHRCENARHHGVVWSTDALPARACAGVCRCDRKWQARRRCERRARPCTQSMAAGDRPRVTSLRLPGKRVVTEGCLLQTLRPRAVRAHSGGARGGVCGSGYRARVTAHQVCSRRP